MKIPRLSGWFLVALLSFLLVAFFAPQQVFVTCYKITLLAIAGFAGYWFDRSAFPESRTSFLFHIWREDSTNITQAAIVLAAAMLRKAIIIAAAMIAVSLGA